DEALAWVQRAVADREAVSIGLLGNAAAVYDALVRRKVIPDMVTDQTAAHDALIGYVPEDLTLAEADALRKSKPDEYVNRSKASMAKQVEAMLAFQKAGAVVFDYGNNIRQQAYNVGVTNAFDFPGFVPAY